MGPYEIAPRSASISLKKGNAIASKVATTTKVVLPVSLKKLMLKLNFLLPILSGYSVFTNSELGHLMLAHDSNVLNIGWASTCQLRETL
jgi:hypothetical protein